MSDDRFIAVEPADEADREKARCLEAWINWKLRTDPAYLAAYEKDTGMAVARMLNRIILGG